MIKRKENPDLDTSACETLDLSVTFSELVEGDTAELAFYTLKTLRNGNAMPCSQVVQIRDESLLRRLRAVKPGDQMQVTIETDWEAEDIPTVLKAFRLV